MPQPDPRTQRALQSRSRLFRDTELVYPHLPDGPRFADQVWNIAALVSRASQAERELNFADIPEAWVLPTREVLMVMAQPDHPHVVSVGVVRKADAAPLTSFVDAFQRLRVIAGWAARHDLDDLTRWTQRDADRLLDDLRTGGHRDDGEPLAPSTVCGYVTIVKWLRTFGPALTNRGLSFQPWGARSAATVAGSARSVENKTPPLRWDTWAPAVAASWVFVDRFSADILNGVSSAAALPTQARGPSGRNALRVIRSWVANGGKIPLHTGVGRDSGQRGTPNRALLCRQLAINPNTFRPSHGQYCTEAIDLIMDLAQDPTRSHFGGLSTPTVTVSLDDGRQWPWIDELGLGELELLVSVLRVSAYVLLASLTGMRDSELQELTRDASTTSDGLPALASVQYKGERTPNGRPRTWFGPPPVFRTLHVLAALSPHPTHLFARSETNTGNYDPQRDIPRLLSFVNGDPTIRPGRGHGLGLKPIRPTPATSLNQTSLRRSFCVYAARYPGAELGLGIQLGHAALRTTTGYMTDSQQHVAQLFGKDRQDVAREQVAALILDAPAVTGSPKAELATMRAQVIADPTRVDRVIDSAGERYHLGFFNDCLWNKARSGCGPDGPKLAHGVCKGATCGNALFRPEHLPPVAAHVERIDAFLDSGRGHPALLEDLRSQRALYSRVIAEIQADAAPEDN